MSDMCIIASRMSKPVRKEPFLEPNLVANKHQQYWGYLHRNVKSRTGLVSGL